MDKNFSAKSFKLNEDLIISEVKDEAILLNSKTGIYFKTNNVGTFILKLLNEIQSFENLSKEIIMEYEVPKTQTKMELEKFLNKLIEKELVEIL